MYFHYIFTATSYTRHKRAAYDLVLQKDQIYQAKSVRQEIKNRNIYSIPTSLHIKEIDSAKSEDLMKEDPYFEGIHFCKSLDEFMEFLQADLDLSSSDIGKYILSRIDGTKLKIQKLLYLCYRRYFKKKNQPLFTDKIYAFEYSPIAEDFYNLTKDYHDELMRDKIIPDFDSHTPIQQDCRIARAQDGLLKFQVILDVLDEYGEMSAAELVDLTHQPDSAWSCTYDGRPWREIPDSVILNTKI